MSILERLWANGHAAYAVGGGVRDWLLGRSAKDWDVASDARPERMLELFPDGHYENKFGTVTVDGVQVTTFRRDHLYGDHRRPDSVTFTDSIEEDLARRDFTVNAIAWGRASGEDEPRWVDPTGGRADIDARLLRAVGDAERRFDEDALRLVRAARLAGQLGFAIEPATQAAMRRTAALVAFVSRERLGGELRRMLGADPPSTSLRILADTGLLGHAFPLLEANAWRTSDRAMTCGHGLATRRAAALEGSSERLRLAALLHDVGKPTFADGHPATTSRCPVGRRLPFGGLPTAGATSGGETDRAAHVQCPPSWSDAAVRHSRHASDRIWCRPAALRRPTTSAAAYRRRRPVGRVALACDGGAGAP
jgi:tRNA nucleotidyltransferase/poly(A) polymerase